MVLVHLGNGPRTFGPCKPHFSPIKRILDLKNYIIFKVLGSLFLMSYKFFNILKQFCLKKPWIANCGNLPSTILLMKNCPLLLMLHVHVSSKFSQPLYSMGKLIQKFKCIGTTLQKLFNKYPNAIELSLRHLLHVH